ncbi:MAG TPA: rhodanese-like domain-containing protein [Caldithrix abyssi]|uniref:Rhodanese-like domain-containing protein n=1 Tax=Caldithrix abyssi TaxID=187145 RepID=A0A7V4WVR5_CALAY|nr:rhodanese-like domain-containing protein [Caldithrix abyssi]
MKNLNLKTIGFGTLILLGLILAFSPVDQMAHKHVDTAFLLQEISNQSHYVAPDEVAHWVIDKDPSVQIIDIRSKEDYDKYHIPGSEWIPLANLLSDEAKDILDPDKTIVLASNGNSKAAQAWVLLKEAGYDDVYVLMGGMNYWVQVFTNPEKPNGAYTDEEIFAYQFRKAAGPVLMGTQVAASTDTEINKPKKVIKRRRKKPSKKLDEGC